VSFASAAGSEDPSVRPMSPGHCRERGEPLRLGREVPRDEYTRAFGEAGHESIQHVEPLVLRDARRRGPCRRRTSL
jgi:hypothetical protein